MNEEINDSSGTDSTTSYEITYTSTTDEIVEDISALYFGSEPSFKAIWEIEEEIEIYQREMNRVIDPKYELPKIGRMFQTGRDHRDYYHLYKHRSF